MRKLYAQVKQRLAAFKANAAGSSAVELAFVIPVVSVMAVGAFDAGRAITTGSSLEAAAQAGVQYARTNPGLDPDDATDAQTITDEITTVARDAADDQTLNVTAAYYCRCNSTGNANQPCVPCSGYKKYATVVVTKTLTPIFDYPGLPESFTLEGNAEIRID